MPGSNEFTATLFDLSGRGRYKATPVTTSVRSGAACAPGRGRPPVALADETSDGPLRGARYAGGGLDRRRRRRAASEFRDEIEGDREGTSKRFKTFKEQVTTAIDERGWYLSRGWSCSSWARRISRSQPSSSCGWASTVGARRLPLERRRPRRAGRVRAANAAVLLIGAPRAPLWRRRSDHRPDRGPALGGVPPLPDRLPASPGGASGPRSSSGSPPRVRDRVRDRGTRPQGAHLHMPESFTRRARSSGSARTADLGSGPTSLGFPDLSSGSAPHSHHQAPAAVAASLRRGGWRGWRRRRWRRAW